MTAALEALALLNLGDPNQRPELTRARAAVAELAAASRSFRDAVAAIQAYPMHGQPGFDGTVYVDLLDSRDRALSRLNFAMESVQYGSSGVTP